MVNVFLSGKPLLADGNGSGGQAGLRQQALSMLRAPRQNRDIKLDCLSMARAGGSSSNSSIPLKSWPKIASWPHGPMVPVVVVEVEVVVGAAEVVVLTILAAWKWKTFRTGEHPKIPREHINLCGFTKT